MMSRNIFLVIGFLSIGVLSVPETGASSSHQQPGLGSLLVIGRESVSLDTLNLMHVRVDGAMGDSSTRSTGRGWTRFANLPSGEHELEVFQLDFEPRRAAVRIRAGKEDTVTVMLTPTSPVKPGNTYVFHPPAPLPERPGDEQKYPLAGFSFSFLTEHGERVDTAKGLVTKDMVGDLDITISLVLSPSELDRVRKSMIAMRFFDVGYAPPSPWPGRFDSPHIEATAGGVTKRLEPLDQGGNMYPSDEWKRIRDLIELIRETVSARPEYQALPKSRGAYL